MKKFYSMLAVLTATLVLGCSGGGSDGGNPGPGAIAVTGVTLDKTASGLVIGNTLTLTATVLPADATDKTVTWESDNENAATVADGVVTGVAVGTATITVTTVDGNHTATCDITVTATAVAVTGVTLNKTTLALEVGGTEQLTPTIAPLDATNTDVTWESDTEAVATVSATGLVTAVSEGTATITVTTDDGGKTATCDVTVTAPAIVTDGTLDTNWTGKELGTEPTSDEKASANVRDITGFYVTNDSNWLYVCITLNGSDDASWTEQGFFIDTDNTAGSGSPLAANSDNMWTRVIRLDSSSTHLPDFEVHGNWAGDGYYECGKYISGSWKDLAGTGTDRTAGKGNTWDVAFNRTNKVIEFKIKLSSLGVSTGNTIYLRGVSTGNANDNPATDVAPVDDSGAGAEAATWGGTATLWKSGNSSGAYVIQ